MMDENTLAESKVKRAVSVVLQIPVSDIENSDLINDDLGGDSLDHVEIAMWLEEDLDIQIPDSIWDEIKTVAQLCEVVTKVLLEKKNEN